MVIRSNLCMGVRLAALLWSSAACSVSCHHIMGSVAATNYLYYYYIFKNRCHDTYRVTVLNSRRVVKSAKINRPLHLHIGDKSNKHTVSSFNLINYSLTLWKTILWARRQAGTARFTSYLPSLYRLNSSQFESTCLSLLRNFFCFF